jgi:hypothetical protein
MKHVREIRKLYRTLVGNPDRHFEDREVDRRTKRNIKTVLQEKAWLCMIQSTGSCQNFLQRQLQEIKFDINILYIFSKIWRGWGKFLIYPPSCQSPWFRIRTNGKLFQTKSRR